MSSCPLPQNTSHLNSNRPVRSGTMRTRVTSPDFKSARTLSSGILKPWSRSSAVISKMTGTPFLSVISLGLYSNLFAVMCTTCSAPAGTAAVAKRCHPAAIPTAARTTRAVGRRPVPVGGEVEQRAVREHDDRGFLVELPEVGTEPLDLVVAQLAPRIGDVVEHDEVHALVIERVLGLAEELLERRGAVERRVVLAREIPLRLHLELPHGVAHVRQALPALLVIVGRVREIAREDDEVGLVGERVHVSDRLVERPLGIRVHRRTREAPVEVGHLEEHEVLRPALAGGEAHAAEPRAEDDARNPGRSQARELDEFASIQVSRHLQCTSDSGYTGTPASDWAAANICSRPRW